MNYENQHMNNEELQTKNMYEHCNNYMHHHVLLNNKDGSSFDGIIVDVDVTTITVLVGEDLMDDETEYRQYGGYGVRPPRRRFRRYRPRRFPLASLAALSLFPYVFGYPGYSPYPYSPYPYY